MERRKFSSDPIALSRRPEKLGKARTGADNEETKTRRLQLAEAKRVVRKQGWLAGQPQRFQSALLKQSRLQHFSAGSPVFKVDELGGGLFGVVQGTFGSYVPQRNGHDGLVNIFRPGMWFGYGPFLTRRGRMKTFTALEPALALHIPLRELDQLAISDVVYLRALTRITEYGMEIAIDTMADLLIPNVEKRIAATLLRVARTKGIEPTGPLVISGLTQAQIGELANAARDVVNQTLQRFKAKGWIDVSYRRVVLLDLAAMEEFCS